MSDIAISLRSGPIPSFVVAAASLIWGAWWIPLRALEARGFRGDWVTVWLGIICASVLLVPVLIRRDRWRHQLKPLAAIGILSGIGFAAWNHALVTGDVIRVTLLFYLAPVWGTVFAVTILRRKLTRWRIFAVVLGLGGAMVVLGRAIPIPSEVSEWMAVASGLAFAATATVIARVGTLGDIEKNFASFAGAAIFGLVFVVGPGASSPIPDISLGALPLLLGISALMLALQAMLLWGAGKMDPGRFTVLLLFEVASATITASIAADSLPGWRESLGCLLILGCGLMDAVDQRKDHLARLKA